MKSHSGSRPAEVDEGPGSRRFRDLIRRERQDMAWLVGCVAAMYDEISGGRISKPMTYPSEVVGIFEQRMTEEVEDALRKAREIIEDHQPDVASWIDDSSWLTCSCGWDSSEPKAPGWSEHVIAALETTP